MPLSCSGSRAPRSLVKIGPGLRPRAIKLSPVTKGFGLISSGVKPRIRAKNTRRFSGISLPFAKRSNKIISVDPKEEHFKYYRGITVITPNNHEASRAVGFPIKDDKTLKRAGEVLLSRIGCKIALVTLGENGMAVFRKGRPMEHIPTVAQEVFDVSGAGDTVIAAYTLGLASGGDPVKSAYIANCAAGIVVGKVGIAVVDPGELIDRIEREFNK